MKSLARLGATLLLLLLTAAPALAQWQVPAHAIPLGRGAGVVGFNSLASAASGKVLLGQGVGVDPAFNTVSGDATISSAGAVTLDSEIHCLAALTSAADKIAYYTGSGTCALTDLGSTARTFLTTSSSANLRSLLSDEVGTGAAYFVGGALGTPASGVATNLTGTASGLTAGNVTTNANLTGPITSVGNATSIASQTGTGTKFVVDTSPTLVTPILGVAAATSINKVAITAPATSATLTIPDGVTLTGPSSSGTAMTLGNAETVTGAKTFGSAGAVGKLKIAGTTSGSTILDATATASGTLTLPAATDTLVGKATTDTFTNKTFDTAGAGNSLSINGVAATANTGTGSVVRATSPTLVTPVLGAASATSINISSGGAISALLTGTYTPTLTNTTNLDSSTASVTGYYQIGDRVTVFGTVTVDPTASATTILGFSLPIASALSAASQLGGSGSSTLGNGWRILGDAANDRAQFDATPSITSSHTISFSFSYQVI